MTAATIVMVTRRLWFEIVVAVATAATTAAAAMMMAMMTSSTPISARGRLKECIYWYFPSCERKSDSYSNGSCVQLRRAAAGFLTTLCLPGVRRIRSDRERMREMKREGRGKETERKRKREKTQRKRRERRARTMTARSFAHTLACSEWDSWLKRRDTRTDLTHAPTDRPTAPRLAKRPRKEGKMKQARTTCTRKEREGAREREADREKDRDEQANERKREGERRGDTKNSRFWDLVITRFGVRVCTATRSHNRHTTCVHRRTRVSRARMLRARFSWWEARRSDEEVEGRRKTDGYVVLSRSSLVIACIVCTASHMRFTAFPLPPLPLTNLERRISIFPRIWNSRFALPQLNISHLRRHNSASSL